jgi:hypothetical protein
VGTALQQTGRLAAAVVEYRRSLAMLERVEKPAPVDVYNMACCQALLAAAARLPGSGLTEAEGRDLADKAMSTLQKAVAAGYRRPELFKHDPDLALLRQEEDFKKLMTELDARLEVKSP